MWLAAPAAAHCFYFQISNTTYTKYTLGTALALGCA
jgi:hypothetical protein